MVKRVDDMRDRDAESAVKEAYLSTNDPNERAKWEAVLRLLDPEYFRPRTT